MNNNKNNKTLIVITLMILIVIVIQSSYNIIQTNKLSKSITTTKLSTIKSSNNQISGETIYTGIARAEMCINTPPRLTYDCNMTNATLKKATTYNCTFDATDSNSDDIIYSINWLTSPMMFNITPSGEINFIPNSTAIGTNTFDIYINDTSGCTNSYTAKEFNVTVSGENEAPYLMKNIPNQQVIKDQYFRFYLNDYFADPDYDQLSYFSILQQGNTVRIKIVGNTVDIKGVGCGISKVYFVATDPFGLTAQSNTVEYEVTCPPESIIQNNTGRGSSGSSEIRPTCEPDWRCSLWAPCSEENITYQRCLDYNGCEEKYEQFMFKNCTYEHNTICEEKWDCNDWSICTEGLHTRACMDLRNCGTNTTRPIESETCSKISTCYNNIIDGDETGIDCGGSCGACRIVEKPSQIKIISLITLVTLSLILIVISVILFIFKNRLMHLYIKIFNKQLKSKKIYLTNKQKEKLIQSVNIIQVRLNEHKINHAIDEISIFSKEYFRQLLTLEIFEKEELISKIVKLNNKDLEKILVMFYAKIINTIHLRNRGAEIRVSEIQSLIDEISHEIYLVSEFNDQDAIKSVKERVNKVTNETTPLDIIYTKLSNVYIALKFEEISVAKNTYKELLKEYEKLSSKDKAIIYTDIIRVFHAINYLEKQYYNHSNKKPIVTK